MGLGIFLITVGLFILLASKMCAELISLKSDSKTLELGLTFFISFFGLIFIVLGSLVFLDLVHVVSHTSNEKSYIFIVFGGLNILLSPMLSNLFIKKFPDNEYVKIIGRKGFYLFYIGLGILSLMIGIFGLTGF